MGLGHINKSTVARISEDTCLSPAQRVQDPDRTSLPLMQNAVPTEMNQSSDHGRNAVNVVLISDGFHGVASPKCVSIHGVASSVGTPFPSA